ncbi:MAG TPA: Gfo/Idh/MocA family oxidoreductase [Candidatus Aquicultor sp.]
MNSKYNVLIIGAGNIGASFDTPETVEVLTHAHAFKKHERFKLLGFVDANEEKARSASLLWGSKSYPSVEEAFSKEKIDVVCVAVPDEHHYAILKKLSTLPLQVIFAEKPITKTLDQAKDIVQVLNDRRISTVVNYTRRFVPEFEKIRHAIEDGTYGEFLTGTGYYGKGIVHNGSHLVDLVRYFIGEIDSVGYVSSISDFYPDDESVAAILTIKKDKSFFLQYADCNNYTMFELDMFFKMKRIRISDLGFKVEEYDVKESKVFKGFKNIVRTTESNTSFSNALYNAADNIYAHLSQGQDLKCSAEDAYKTLQTCLQIKESAKR